MFTANTAQAQEVESMHLPDIINFTTALQKPLSIDEVLQTNQETQPYGLILTPGDALEIVAARNRSILDHNPVSYTHLTLPTNREV